MVKHAGYDTPSLHTSKVLIHPGMSRSMSRRIARFVRRKVQCPVVGFIGGHLIEGFRKSVHLFDYIQIRDRSLQYLNAD